MQRFSARSSAQSDTLGLWLKPYARTARRICISTDWSWLITCQVEYNVSIKHAVQGVTQKRHVLAGGATLQPLPLLSTLAQQLRCPPSPGHLQAASCCPPGRYRRLLAAAAPLAERATHSGTQAVLPCRSRHLLRMLQLPPCQPAVAPLQASAAPRPHPRRHASPPAAAAGGAALPAALRAPALRFLLFPACHQRCCCWCQNLAAQAAPKRPARRPPARE